MRRREVQISSRPQSRYRSPGGPARDWTANGMARHSKGGATSDGAFSKKLAAGASAVAAAWGAAIESRQRQVGPCLERQGALWRCFWPSWRSWRQQEFGAVAPMASSEAAACDVHVQTPGGRSSSTKARVWPTRSEYFIVVRQNNDLSWEFYVKLGEAGKAKALRVASALRIGYAVRPAEPLSLPSRRRLPSPGKPRCP